MVQRKYFTNIEGLTYIEDEEGFCLGVEWVNVLGHSFRCIWSHVDKLSGSEKVSVLVFRTFKKSSGEIEWFWFEEMRAIVDGSQYRGIGANNKGVLYKDGFLENDTTKPIYGPGEITEEDPSPEDIIVGYEQKIKADIIPENKFFNLAVFRGLFGSFPLDDVLFKTICEKYNLLIE